MGSNTVTDLGTRIAFVEVTFTLLLSRRNRIDMSEENSTGNNLIWAITTIIVVAVIGAALYFVVLRADSPAKKTDVDVEIKAPAPSR